jgi:hypothetical protein
MLSMIGHPSGGEPLTVDVRQSGSGSGLLQPASGGIKQQVLLLIKIGKTLEKYVSGWRDSNPRPPAPKAGALTKLRYIPLL